MDPESVKQQQVAPPSSPPESPQAIAPQPKKKRGLLFIGLALLIFTVGIPIILAVIFLFLYVFIAQPFQISGSTMSPNFVNGQYYLANKLSYLFASPSRGDVIIFRAPTAPDKDYIKRIIGLPNETVTLQNGKILINNRPLDESTYLAASIETNGNAFLQEGQQKTIPVGNYFVLGDNRSHSSDSREWGFVPKENIIGKISLCYYQCELSKK